MTAAVPAAYSRRPTSTFGLLQSPINRDADGGCDVRMVRVKVAPYSSYGEAGCGTCRNHANLPGWGSVRR